MTTVTLLVQPTVAAVAITVTRLMTVTPTIALTTLTNVIQIGLENIATKKFTQQKKTLFFSPFQRIEKREFFLWQNN